MDAANNEHHPASIELLATPGHNNSEIALSMQLALSLVVKYSVW